MTSESRPASKSGGRSSDEGHGQDHGDSRYFCLPCSDQRGKNPGGAGPSCATGPPGWSASGILFHVWEEESEREDQEEKKLESDRRLFDERIGQLKAELEDVKRHREVARQQRDRDCTVSAAIVGYTNAGKSTLLNYLTDAGILAEDKLFATLDPTTRMLKLPSGQNILLTDTVGFIRKLPHNLIVAFKSTLEEARYSDIILHVADVSNPQLDTQIDIVYETLCQPKSGIKPLSLYSTRWIS